jgi:hypothetical protein
VVGWSGGAPYAAAVAAPFPDRLTGHPLACSQCLCYIVESTERDDEDRQNLDAIEQFSAAEATQRYANANQSWADGLQQAPESILDDGGISDGDRWVVDDPILASPFCASVREALCQGAVGAASDWVMLVAPWGFSAGDIKTGAYMWHGAQDTVSIDEFGCRS